jgi:1,4-alpha-glucan branching enzyme
MRTTGEVKLTFALSSDDPRLPASVVGDFNGWDPRSHPLKARSNQTHSATVTVAGGGRYCFRYRAQDGTWFDESDADGLQANQYGGEDCVVIT